jgi:hypothetical protein
MSGYTQAKQGQRMAAKIKAVGAAHDADLAGAMEEGTPAAKPPQQ